MARDLNQWLEYIESLSTKHIDMGLERVGEVAQRLSLNFSASKTVTIAGTNGKGSAVSALQAIALSSNRTVACYTSPHLVDFKERLLINGKMLSDQEWIEAFLVVEETRGSTSLTYFEFVTLAALLLCTKHQTDWLILEVGLGGRLDAVNIIEPDVAVITSIALDHEDWLGHSLMEIGAEKAGIYRLGKPLFIATEKLRQYLPSSVQTSDHVQSTDYFLESLTEELKLFVKNISTQVFPTSFLLALRVAGYLGVDYANLRPSQIKSNLSLPGRWQKLGNKNIWLDVAHNPQALDNLLDKINQQQGIESWWLVFGQLKDKKSTDCLSNFTSINGLWFPVSTPGPRGMSADSLLAKLDSVGVATAERVYDATDLTSLLEKYLSLSAQEQSRLGIIAFGSFHVVANMIEYYQDHKQRFLS